MCLLQMMGSFQAITQPLNVWDLAEFSSREFYTRLSVLRLTRRFRHHLALETVYQVGGTIALYLALANVCVCVGSNSNKETVQKISLGEGVSLPHFNPQFSSFFLYGSL